jgi:hypothetical protein
MLLILKRKIAKQLCWAAKKASANQTKRANNGCKIADAGKVQTADQGKVYEVGCSTKKGKADYRISTSGTVIGMIDKK